MLIIYAIQYAKQDLRTLEHLLERTEKLGRRLPRLRPHEQQFLAHPEMKPCLEWIYQDLLRYYADVIKLFEARSETPRSPLSVRQLLTRLNRLANHFCRKLERSRKKFRSFPGVIGPQQEPHFNITKQPPDVSRCARNRTAP